MAVSFISNLQQASRNECLLLLHKLPPAWSHCSGILHTPLRLMVDRGAAQLPSACKSFDSASEALAPASVSAAC